MQYFFYVSIVILAQFRANLSSRVSGAESAIDFAALTLDRQECPRMFYRTIKIDYREIADNGNNGFATEIRR